MGAVEYTKEYILLRSSEGRARNRNGWILVPRVSSSSSVGYAEGYAEDSGVVDGLATSLFGRAWLLSVTAVGCSAAPVRLFARGRLVVVIVKGLSMFNEMERHSLEWFSLYGQVQL